MRGPEPVWGRMLEIDEAVKRFGLKTAVDGTGFAIDKPAMIWVVGQSEAGKSTLLRMLNRLSAQASSL